ncbi:13923_t:CDS:2, partial [Racocetra fulgida]
HDKKEESKLFQTCNSCRGSNKSAQQQKRKKELEDRDQDIT